MVNTMNEKDIYTMNAEKGERIAKYLSRAGIASRREIERLIDQGLIKVNGKIVETPAFFVTAKDHIKVRNQVVCAKQETKIWTFYKPKGCLTADFDPEGRTTVFELLPKDLPRVMAVGRLDYNSEGLLLLTNDGGFKRYLELPNTDILRCYRVRAFGDITQERLDILAKGVVVDGIHYAPVYAELDKIQGKNAWITFTLSEGKNREIRKLMTYLGYDVNRLIRVNYGAFSLGKMQDGDIKEVPQEYLLKKYPDYFKNP
jgi:23S rRNA pseudouridine2605 synthase